MLINFPLNFKLKFKETKYPKKGSVNLDTTVIFVIILNNEITLIQNSKR